MSDGDKEDAYSEGSFQSADEDDIDLPQDLGVERGHQGGTGAASSSAAAPGLQDSEEGGFQQWNLKRDGNREMLQQIWERLYSERDHVKISKMFSYVLRHAAHKLDVRIRKDGFVRLKEIMSLKNFKPYALDELLAVVYFDEKERYTLVKEFDGELLIRANQGHTMKVVESDLLLEQIVDPKSVTDCVHGTYLVHWPFIKKQGLSKVARNHIHLAAGLPEDGKIRGMRSTAELFVYVDVPKALEDGMVFYRSKNEVILTQGFGGWLPVKYFIKAVRIDYNTCHIEELDFERDVEIPNWAAELAPSGPGDQGTYQIKNLEALITHCRKRMQEINEIKAQQELGHSLSEEEQLKLSQYPEVYTELQSLEQRFRQHKGYRRETPQEKEQRAKEEAEAASIVKKKDRAVTPPWQRGQSSLESVGTKASERDNAVWSAIGRRRDHAAQPPTPVNAGRTQPPTPVNAGRTEREPREQPREQQRDQREHREQQREQREPPPQEVQRKEPPAPAPQHAPKRDDPWADLGRRRAAQSEGGRENESRTNSWSSKGVGKGASQPSGGQRGQEDNWRQGGRGEQPAQRGKGGDDWRSGSRPDSQAQGVGRPDDEPPWASSKAGKGSQPSSLRGQEDNWRQPGRTDSGASRGKGSDDWRSSRPDSQGKGWGQGGYNDVGSGVAEPRRPPGQQVPPGQGPATPQQWGQAAPFLPAGTWPEPMPGSMGPGMPPSAAGMQQPMAGPCQVGLSQMQPLQGQMGQPPWGQQAQFLSTGGWPEQNRAPMLCQAGPGGQQPQMQGQAPQGQQWGQQQAPFLATGGWSEQGRGPLQGQMGPGMQQPVAPLQPPGQMGQLPQQQWGQQQAAFRWGPGSR